MPTRPEVVPLAKADDAAGLRPVQAISLLPTGATATNADEVARLTLALKSLAQLARPIRLYGIVALTSAEELAFAQVCLAANLPLRLLLPASRQEMETMLPGCEAALVRPVIEAACSIGVIVDGAEGEEGMNDCRVAVFLESPLLLAFSRDGDGCFPAGDAELTRVRNYGLKVVAINPVTGEIQGDAAELFRPPDAELEFLAIHSEPVAVSKTAPPREQAEAWFKRLDARATAIAPNLRRLAATPVIFTASAAVLSVANVLAIGSWILPAISMALGLVAFWAPRIIKTRMRQTEWVRLRVAAEFCRSHLALWEAGDRTDPLLAEAAPELAGMLRALDLMRLTSGAPKPSLAAFKASYGRERIRNQMAYFRLHHRRGKRLMARYSKVAGLAVKGGMFVNAASFVLAVAPTPSWLAKPIAIGIVAPLCFQAAAVASALIAVNDFRRRTQRYAELQEKLAICERGLEASQTWPGALAVAHRVERLLLAEILEFRTLYRHTAIHT